MMALTAIVLVGALPRLGAEPQTLPIWPAGAPGESIGWPAESDTTKPGDQLIAGRRVIRLGNVSRPTISVFKPDPAIDTGAAVVVCPGGGYYILAMDLEGTEVCTWLNHIGVTAVLLKYRVPVGPGKHPEAAPLQDVQRALGLVRFHAAEWRIDPHRIGVLGFSAGGHLAVRLSRHFDVRAYPKVDEADAVSCRPDFCMLVYPAGLTVENESGKVRPEFEPDAKRTPPTFIAMAGDDPVRVENAFAYGSALHAAHVPVELHVYPKGGHGYGLRSTDLPVTTWPDRATDWLRAEGWLNRR
jgi:acetyl esterase/lipase